MNSTELSEENVDNEVLQTLDSLLIRVTESLRTSAFETYRVRNEEMIDISSDSSSDSTSSDESDCSDSDNDGKSVAFNNQLDKKITVTKGELTVYDLPPVENLNIKLPVEELDHMGRVSSIIDVLVVVQSFKNKPVMNLDSILFLKTGCPLGHVFDVFGPVVSPLYSIRFNSTQEIAEKNIVLDMAVFYAPNYAAPITDYVFYQQLLAIRGSDASWKHNNEPPEEYIDYSDDEQERMSKLKSRAKRKYNESPSSYRVPPNTPNSPKMLNYCTNSNLNSLHVPKYFNM